MRLGDDKRGYVGTWVRGYVGMIRRRDKDSRQFWITNQIETVQAIILAECSSTNTVYNTFSVLHEKTLAERDGNPRLVRT